MTLRVFVVLAVMVLLEWVAAFPVKGACTGTEFRTTQLGSSPLLVTASEMATDLPLGSIKLVRRNWESHGTDISIRGDGTYTVRARFLGKSRVIFEGKLPQDKLRDLYEATKEVQFFGLPEEYNAPFKTDRGWWGYQLTIESGDRLKSLRFHSEDNSVPEPLKALVDEITTAVSSAGGGG